MGTAGYAGMADLWAKQDTEAVAAGRPPPFSEIKDVRTRRWTRARSKSDESTGYVPALFNSNDIEAYQKLKDANDKKQKGEFRGDVFIEGLGDKEHPGCTRGVGALAPWKIGLNWSLEDKRASKRARQALFKETLRKRLKEEIIAELRGIVPPSPPSTEDVPIADLHRSRCASTGTGTAGISTDAS